MFKKASIFIFFILLTSCMPTDFLKDTKRQKAKAVFTKHHPKRNIANIININSRKIRNIDRYYIRSVLREVFDNTATVNSIILNKIFSHPEIFGGECDIYEQSRTVTKALENNDSNCHSSITTFIQNLPSSSLRQGYIISTCEAIISQPTARNFSFSKAGVNPSVDILTPILANKLYQLFYPIDDMPVITYNVLLKYSDKFTSTQEMWINYLTQICYSPDWQSL